MNITPMDDGTVVKTFRIENPQHLEFLNPEDEMVATPTTEEISSRKAQAATSSATANSPKSKVQSSKYFWVSLRQSFYYLPLDLYLKAGKCQELLYWDFNTKFCGVCGAPMKMHTDISKRCTACGKEVWPQLATAIIVLIHRDDEVLLVHARNFNSDFYGLVAGFVETGETLEEAVRREVMEETGLTIKNLKYFGSQPWPYPCGLMVGFMADYDAGSVHLQRSELSKGNWFHHDRLPRIPEKLSIARKLIDAWLEQFNDTATTK